CGTLLPVLKHFGYPPGYVFFGAPPPFVVRVRPSSSFDLSAQEFLYRIPVGGRWPAASWRAQRPLQSNAYAEPSTLSEFDLACIPLDPRCASVVHRNIHHLRSYFNRMRHVVRIEGYNRDLV